MLSSHSPSWPPLEQREKVLGTPSYEECSCPHSRMRSVHWSGLLVVAGQASSGHPHSHLATLLPAHRHIKTTGLSCREHEGTSTAQGHDLPVVPHIPTLGLASTVSCTYLAQVYWVPPDTGPGHLLPLPTCFSQGTNMNRTGVPRVNTAPRAQKFRLPWTLTSLEAS